MQGLLQRFRRCGAGRVALVLAALVLMTEASFATAPASCTAVSSATGAAAPTFAGLVGCVMDSIGVYGVLAALIAVIVPLLVIMWGMRSGVGLTSALFRKAAGALGRH